MGYLKSKFINSKTLLLITLFTVIYIIGKIIGKDNLNDYSSISGPNIRYTYGRVYDFESQSEGSEEVKFMIYINGKSYNGSFPKIDKWSKDLHINSLVLYKYDKLNPSEGKVIYNFKVKYRSKIGQVFKFKPQN